MSATSKRLETVERRLLRPRRDVDELRADTRETMTVIAAGLMEDMNADVVEVDILNGRMTRQPGETLDSFKGRILAAVADAVSAEPMPLRGLASFYKFMPLLSAS